MTRTCIMSRQSISIHAPTRGATKTYNAQEMDENDFNPRSHERSDKIPFICQPCHKLFQSTLPREERPKRCPQSPKLFPDFNPRSHERSDRNLQLSFFPYSISIHAPTRGATVRRSFLSEPIDDFNPRSHERSDMQAVLMMVIKATFQSTLPREERPGS